MTARSRNELNIIIGFVKGTNIRKANSQIYYVYTDLLVRCIQRQGS